MLGDILRAEREKRGLTIKDIENETSIRSVYIEAIEKGDYKALPEAVYARGFVRNYATLLGLNAGELVQMFKDETGETTAAQASEEKAQQGSREVSRPSVLKKEKSLFSSGDDFHERVEKSHRTQNILVTVAVLVLAFVGSIYYFFGDDSSVDKPAAPPAQKQTASTQPAPAAPKAEQQTNTAAPQQKQPEAKLPAAQPQQGAATVVGTGEISVAAQFSKQCWTQVIADGKTIFEGTIEPGQSFNWQGKATVTVLAGNAGAVRIAHNGKDIGSLGKEGEVVEKRFTKDKVEAVK